MEITFSTPAMLFPTISLLLLAYTNRFLGLASLIRSLHSQYKTNPNAVIGKQISNLRYRIMLIKNMQAFGIASLLLCVVCMLFLFLNIMLYAKLMFIVSLVLMVISLTLSIREIQVSVDALKVHLEDMDATHQ